MSLLGTLRSINRRIGNPARVLGRVREAVEPKLRMMKFERDRRERERQYAKAAFAFTDQSTVVRRIEQDGYAIIKRAMARDALLELRRQAEAHLDGGTSLLPVSRDSVREGGDRGAAVTHLSAEEVRRGQAYLRQHTNYASIADPLVSCSSGVRIAFDSQLIDIAHAYLGCVPAIGGLNLRKSYVNTLPEFDTLFFHVDPNSPKFLKFFFYLNDVDLQSGPFCYVRGSHRKRFPGWKSKPRWSLEEMEAVFGRDAIVHLTAELGDLLVADTNGFHRGTKVVARDRFMLTVDYVIHEEFEGTQNRVQFRLPQDVLDSLPPRERAVADFLAIA